MLIMTSSAQRKNIGQVVTLNWPCALLVRTMQAQERNGRTAYRSAAVYPHLVATTPEGITPAVAPRVKQWDTSTGSAIESFGSVTF